MNGETLGADPSGIKLETAEENLTEKEELKPGGESESKFTDVSEKSDREAKGDNLEKLRKDQAEEDVQRLEAVRKKLKKELAPGEQEETSLDQRERDELYSNIRLNQLVRYIGIKVSDRLPKDQVEAMGKRVIDCLGKEYPQFNLQARLEGEEQRTILVTNTTINDFAYKQQGFPNWIRAAAKYLPFQSAGFYFRDIGTIVNGGLPNFLIERTMFHEYIHAASPGVFNPELNEGATEYYARKAAAKNGLLQNIVNPAYLPGLLSYALMKRAAGNEIADQAFFNGKVGDFVIAVDNKWDVGAFAKVNKWSHGFGGIVGFGYAAFKSLTQRGQK